MVVRETTRDGITLVEKRLDPRLRAVHEARTRFRHEARLLERLDGGPTPGLVDAGDDAEGPFLRMGKVAFPTLAERLAVADGHALDAAWVERALRSALTALSALHEARDPQGPLAIVHADLSPANVAIDDDGTRAVLLDLGLAWWRESEPRDGAFRGTARYCAPEIARGETPTCASDLFALAASFLHAMTGMVPRDAPSLGALVLQAAEQPLLDAPRLAAFVVPDALARCLAHDPAARPASARAVLASLC